jgi:hypothetical protein
MIDWLPIFLPTFLVAFTSIYFLWNFIRRKNLRDNILIKIFLEIQPANLFKEKKETYFILITGTALSFIYALFPNAYRFLWPIEVLNKPLITYSGIIILKVSLMLLFTVNMQSDLNLLDKIENNNHEKFALRINKLLHSSIILMLFGLFFTIPSIGTFVLASVAIVYYFMLIKE